MNCVLKSYREMHQLLNRIYYDHSYLVWPSGSVHVIQFESLMVHTTLRARELSVSAVYFKYFEQALPLISKLASAGHAIIIP